jgi:hypothetical protein
MALSSLRFCAHYITSAGTLKGRRKERPARAGREVLMVDVFREDDESLAGYG